MSARSLPLLVLALTVGCGAADPLAAQLVPNEISATNADFVEFYNATDAALDVSGYGATDSRDDGLPRLSRTIRFPAGTTIPARGFLVAVWEGECPAASQTYVCVRAQSLGGGVSQTRGESVHLIDPESRVVSTARYPAAASPDGWTWGRFPNGSGEFRTTRSTPGAANTL